MLVKLLTSRNETSCWHKFHILFSFFFLLVLLYNYACSLLLIYFNFYHNIFIILSIPQVKLEKLKKKVILMSNVERKSRALVDTHFHFIIIDNLLFIIMRTENCVSIL